MPRKSNPEKDKAVSGAAPAASAKPRRQTTTARSRHSAAAAETPVSSVEVSVTEAIAAVSNSSSGDSLTPPREEVARLAYLYWLDRGCEHGSAEEDWLRAEQELRQGNVTAQ